MDIIYFLDILSHRVRMEFLIGEEKKLPFGSAVPFLFRSKQHLSIDHEKFISLSKVHKFISWMSENNPNHLDSHVLT